MEGGMQQPVVICKNRYKLWNLCNYESMGPDIVVDKEDCALR